MNKKPPELPNIEDATLRACLAPLMEAMNAGGEPANQTLATIPVAPATRPPIVAPQSNDNPPPATDTPGSDDRAPACIPKTLAEWRLQTDDEFAVLRMVELFLAMPDAELVTAAAGFPKQINGTVARIGRIKQRLAAQYDRVTAAVAVLQRAQLQASADAETD